MKGLTKVRYSRLIVASALASTCFTVIPAPLTGSGNLTASVTIAHRFVVSFPTSLPSINIDPTNLIDGSNYKYDAGTGNFSTAAEATKYCVYSNGAPGTGGQAGYTIAVDGTTAEGSTALKGKVSNAILPYSLTITDGALNSNTFKIDSNNATSKVMGSNTYAASRSVGCAGNGINGKGTISFQVAGVDWQNAYADEYAAKITLTVSEV